VESCSRGCLLITFFERQRPAAQITCLAVSGVWSRSFGRGQGCAAILLEFGRGAWSRSLVAELGAQRLLTQRWGFARSCCQGCAAVIFALGRGALVAELGAQRLLTQRWGFANSCCQGCAAVIFFECQRLSRCESSVVVFPLPPVALCMSVGASLAASSGSRVCSVPGLQIPLPHSQKFLAVALASP